MEKIYSSDREICSPLLTDSGESFRFKSDLPGEFIDSLPSLFDRTGKFIPQQLRESAHKNGDLYLRLARSPQRELRFLGTAGLIPLGREEWEPLLWEAFHDSFYPVRGLVVDYLEKKERARLFNEIFRKLTNDPRQIIRERAYIRIKKDFSDLFSYRINSFTPEEQYRLLPFLDARTTHDYRVLNDFAEKGTEDVACRALYSLQKQNLGSPRLWADRSRELNLIRYEDLPRFCHGHLPQFPRVFALLGRKSPPALTVQFITELIRHPHNGNWNELYVKGVELVGHLRDGRIGDLIAGFFKNRGVKEFLGPEISRLFTGENQYFTFSFLNEYYRTEEDPRVRKALKRAGQAFSFPCPTEGTR